MRYLFFTLLILLLFTVSTAHAQDSSKYLNPKAIYFYSNFHFRYDHKLIPMNKLKDYIHDDKDAMKELNKSVRYYRVGTVSTIVTIASYLTAFYLASNKESSGYYYEYFAVFPLATAAICNKLKKMHRYKAICLYNQRH